MPDARRPFLCDPGRQRDDTQKLNNYEAFFAATLNGAADLLVISPLYLFVKFGLLPWVVRSCLS